MNENKQVKSINAKLKFYTKQNTLYINKEIA